MSLFTCIQEIKGRLSCLYPDPILCQQYAWWMVEAITHKKQSELLTLNELVLTLEQRAQLEQWIEALVDKHMPIQYLIGSVPFLDLNIHVEPPILIPRPETEEWVANIIDQFHPVARERLSILDLCSGSGCIALALGKAFAHAQIIGADIDEQALLLSKDNAKRNAITNAAFLHSDLYNNLPHAMRYDLIVSNPPYISAHDWHTLDASVTTWEARHALIADDNGLALIKRIINHAPRYLRANTVITHHALPNLVIEIGCDQGAIVAEYMKDATIADVMVHKDLAGKDRVVSGRVINVASASDS